MSGYAAEAERTLIAIRDLFGTPTPLDTPNSPTTTANPNQPGWNGTAAESQNRGATTLTDRHTTITTTDNKLTRWAADVAEDTTRNRNNATALVGSARTTNAALAPYQGTVQGRIALIRALTDHLATAGGLVNDHLNTLPGRQQQLAAATANYNLPPDPNNPTPPPPPRRPHPHHPKRRQPHRRRRGSGAPWRLRTGGGGGGSGFRMPGGLGGGSGMGSGSGLGSLGSLSGALRSGPVGGLPSIPIPRGDGSAGSMAVNFASQKLGKIYKWGGKGGPEDDGRVDCSGLTGWAYRRMGIDIGPDTFTQITKGVQVSPNDIRPGDLIFCNFGSQGGNPGPGHVVMATGYGAGSRIIEASTSGAPVAFGSMPHGRIVVKRIVQ